MMKWMMRRNGARANIAGFKVCVGVGTRTRYAFDHYLNANANHHYHIATITITITITITWLESLLAWKNIVCIRPCVSIDISVSHLMTELVSIYYREIVTEIYGPSCSVWCGMWDVLCHVNEEFEFIIKICTHDVCVCVLYDVPIAWIWMY